YDSLALTGKGHGTDKAIQLGLAGTRPEAVDPDEVESIVSGIRSSGELTLPTGRTIAFDEPRDLLFLRNESLPYHPTGMAFRAVGADGQILDEYRCDSIGVGFVVVEQDAARYQVSADDAVLAYRYRTWDDLLAMAEPIGLSISSM